MRRTQEISEILIYCNRPECFLKTDVAKMTHCSLERARSVITVEPVFLIYSLANNLRAIILQTLLYDKVCATKYNNTVCDNLHDPIYLHEETVVQRVSMMRFMTKMIIYTQDREHLFLLGRQAPNGSSTRALHSPSHPSSSTSSTEG